MVIFALRSVDEQAKINHHNRLHPHYLIYLDNDGDVVTDHRGAATLVGTGCDGAQGLRYGPPTTPHQVPALLRRTGKLVSVPGRVAS